MNLNHLLSGSSSWRSQPCLRFTVMLRTGIGTPGNFPCGAAATSIRCAPRHLPSELAMKQMKIYESKSPKPFACAVPDGCPAPDMALYAKSLDLDTPKDLAWFAAHPGTRCMARKPTVLEMLAFDFTADDVFIVVQLDADGRCWRHARRRPKQKSDYLPG